MNTTAAEYKPGRLNVFLAPLVVLVLTTLLLALGNCQFETNDDMSMIRVLSGQQGLKATADAVFLSLPLSSLLYQLYKIANTIPWYSLFLYSCLLIGCTIGLRIILSTENGVVTKISYVVAFFGFYSYLVCQLNFAGVSLFLWLTTIAHISLANMTRKPDRISDLFAGCLLGVSYLIRPDIILFALLFSLPAIPSFFAGVSKKRLLATLGPLLIALILTLGFNTMFRSNTEYRSFAEFNKVRSQLVDTHVAEPNTQTMEAMKNTGWTVFDYMLAGDWWFHDAKIYNKNTFSSFISGNTNNRFGIISVKSAIDTIKVNTYNIIIIVLCIAQLIATARKQAEENNNIYNLQLLLTAVTLAAIVAMTAIRFPPRVAIPVLSFLLLISMTTRQTKMTCHRPGNFILICSYCCCAAVILLTFYNYNSQEKFRYTSSQIKNYTDQTISLVQKEFGSDVILVNANVSNISFNSESAKPFKEYRDMVPFTNFPGGWLIASPPYNAFLKDNGFIDRNHAVPRMVGNNKVVFCFWQSPLDNFEQFSEFFLAHLSMRYAQEFPGKVLQLQTVLDTRGVKGNFGWVLFRVHAVPLAGAATSPA